MLLTGKQGYQSRIATRAFARRWNVRLTKELRLAVAENNHRKNNKERRGRYNSLLLLLLQKFYNHSHEVVKAKLKPCFFFLGGGCRKRADNEADIEEESVEDDDNEKADDDGEESAVAEVVKKWTGKTAKKKPGRKPRWSPKALDFIDIVVNNNVYKKKLIFINTKNQSNGSIYEQILKELKERASARGKNFLFKVSQLRNKFKKCVSICKQAALTQNTATGIKWFQEDQGFGKLFTVL